MTNQARTRASRASPPCGSRPATWRQTGARFSGAIASGRGVTAVATGITLAGVVKGQDGASAALTCRSPGRTAGSWCSRLGAATLAGALAGALQTDAHISRLHPLASLKNPAGP